MYCVSGSFMKRIFFFYFLRLRKIKFLLNFLFFKDSLGEVNFVFLFIYYWFLFSEGRIVNMIGDCFIFIELYLING